MPGKRRKLWYNLRLIMRKIRPVLACVLLLVLVPLTALAGPLQDDLKARRARAMERLGPDAVAIFWSAPARVYSADVNYEYRQDSNLLYLTGIDQEETILVLMPGNKTRTRNALRARGGRAAASTGTVTA